MHDRKPTFLPKTNGFYTEDLEKFEQDLEASKALVAGGATTAARLRRRDESMQIVMLERGDFSERRYTSKLCNRNC